MNSGSALPTNPIDDPNNTCIHVYLNCSKNGLHNQTNWRRVYKNVFNSTYLILYKHLHTDTSGHKLNSHSTYIHQKPPDKRIKRYVDKTQARKPHVECELSAQDQAAEPPDCS